MTDTKTLITRLSGEINKSTPPRSAAYLALRLVAVLCIYGFSAQLFLGLRPDLSLQFTRLAFVTEIALLAALALTSTIASILSMYPDAYQKPNLIRLPYIIFLLMAGLVISQLFASPDPRMVIPGPEVNGMECAICIAAITLLPSALILVILRKGASIRHYQSGSLATLTASAIGCLTLRLAEVNDSMHHLATWHYLPTLFFAAIGAYLGKRFLKW